jgi:hypothetical protein
MPVQDPSSRYAGLPEAELTVTDDGGATRVLRYQRRRFLTDPDAATLIAEHQVRQGERLDTIAALYIGDPAQAWRICDANLVSRPDELERTGRIIRIGLVR